MNKRFDALVVAMVLLSSAGASSTPAVGGSGSNIANCAAGQLRCGLSVPGVGAPALSDAAAARLVRRAPWEPRPDNAVDNHRVPSAADLAYFRAHSEMPYKDQVTGAFTGTTDENHPVGGLQARIEPESAPRRGGRRVLVAHVHERR